MKKVAIVQARMNSSRLPGKVLMELAGQPMLAQQLGRLRRCPELDEIVVATTRNAADDRIVDLTRREGVAWFRGSEADVLSRYAAAAREFRAEVVVRLTADCPLLDPAVAGRVIRELADHPTSFDYASNILERTYPRGLDVEALYADTLARVDRMARSQPAREHVTIFIRSERPDLFLCRSVTDRENNADLRWTVDTDRDLELVSILYDRLDLGARAADYAEILSYVRRHPELARWNEGIETWDPNAHPADPCRRR